MADALFSLTPYNYSFNNPVLFNDPLGDYPTGNSSNVDTEQRKEQDQAKMQGQSSEFFARNSGRQSGRGGGIQKYLPGGAPTKKEDSKKEEKTADAGSGENSVKAKGKNSSQGGNVLGVGGNLSAGGGFNFSVGLVKDHNEKYKFFLSYGPSVGFDASLGVFAKTIYAIEPYRGFNVTDYNGYGGSHNVGFGFYDGFVGGDNQKGQYASKMINNYYEVGAGAALGIPISYTYTFSKTHLFGGN